MKPQKSVDNAARRAVVMVCVLMVLALIACLNLADVFPALAAVCGFVFVLLASWLAGYSLKPV